MRGKATPAKESTCISVDNPPPEELGAGGPLCSGRPGGVSGNRLITYSATADRPRTRAYRSMAVRLFSIPEAGRSACPKDLSGWYTEAPSVEMTTRSGTTRAAPSLETLSPSSSPIELIGARSGRSATRLMGPLPTRLLTTLIRWLSRVRMLTALGKML